MKILNFDSFLNENYNNENHQKHQYMMLSRLQSDCEYFLGWGNGSVSSLWGDNVEEHIAEMKRLWNELDVKPEWLSYEEIEYYERKMTDYVPTDNIQSKFKDSYKD